MAIAQHFDLLKTQVTTPAFDQTCLFYGGILGCTLLERWDHAEDAGAIYQIGPGAQLEIYRGPEADLSALRLQFRVPCMDRFLRAARAIWPDICANPRPWGARYCELRDPAGVRVIVFSEEA